MPVQQMLLSGDGDVSFLNAIREAGLTANLELCLDAGDVLSYSSGVKWLDRSGNGYDFFTGDGSTSTTFPTFNGTAGSPSAYWSYDGGDYFLYDTTNEPWMENIHKNNANFTILTMFYQANAASGYLAGDMAAGETGFFLATGAGQPIGTQSFVVRNAGAGVLSKIAGTALSTSAYHFLGVSINEATGAGGGFFYADGSYNQVGGSDTFDSTYSSPASGGATNTMCIGALRQTSPCSSGMRVACFAVWSTALSKANMDILWTAMRGRFGI